MRFLSTLAAIVAAVFLFVACTSDEEPPPPTATPATTAPATTAPATTAAASSTDADDDHDDDDHADEHADDDHADHADDDDADHDHADDDHGDDEHMVASGEAGRIVVTDAVSPYASVIELGSDLVVQGAFEVAAPNARVYSALGGRYAFVLARGPEDADDRIHVFDGGIYTVPHGDHEDLITGPLTRLLDIAEERPIHFNATDEWVAVFSDARGLVFLFNADDLGTNLGAYEPIVLDSGPQHGAAIAVDGDLFIVSTKNPDFPENSDDSLPVGVEVRDLDDNVVYDASNSACPGLHGEAHNTAGTLFGCIGGVLLLQQDGADFSHVFIPNPEGMREDARVGSVYGHAEADTFFVTASYRGDQGWGQDGLWLLDPVTGSFTRVMDESATVSFGPEGERFFVFSADGVLQVLDPDTGEVLSSTADLLEPGGEGRPAMTFLGEDILITDPAAGLVKRVSLDTLSTVAQWEVGGTPASVAYVGTGGAAH